MKYNLSEIMRSAWALFRKLEISFSEALHRAWEMVKAALKNAQAIAEVKALYGVTEEVNTWAGWKAKGYEVKHGSKALFGVNLIWASKGYGVQYKARFFSASQVSAIA